MKSSFLNLLNPNKFVEVMMRDEVKSYQKHKMLEMLPDPEYLKEVGELLK